MDDSLPELEFLDLDGLNDDERRNLRSYLVGLEASPEGDEAQPDHQGSIEGPSGGYDDGLTRFENAGHQEHVAGIPVSSMAPAGYPSPMHHPQMYMTAIAPHQFHHPHQSAVMTTHYPMPGMFHNPGYYVNSMAAAQHHHMATYQHHPVPMPNNQHPFPHYNQPKRKPNVGGGGGRSKYSPRKEIPNGHIVSGDIGGGGGFAYHGQHGSNGPYFSGNPLVQAATGMPIVMHPQPVPAAYLPTHQAVQVSSPSNPPVYQHNPLVTFAQSPPAPVVVAAAAPPAVVMPPVVPVEVVQLPPALSPVLSPPSPTKVVLLPPPVDPPVEKVVPVVEEPLPVMPPPPAVVPATEQMTLVVHAVKSPEPAMAPTASPEVATVVEAISQPASSEEPATESGAKSWASLFKKNVPVPAGATDKPTARVEPFTTMPGTGVNGEIETVMLADGIPNGGAAAALPVRPAAVDVKTRRLAEHLSSYELATTPVALQPRGLINKGNWCYINATLQALIACPPFVHLVKSLTPFANSRGPSEDSTTPIIDSVVDFIDQFDTVPVRTGKDRSSAKKEEPHFGSSFEPSSIYKMLSKIRSEAFKVEGRQEDAEEFLSCLLNGLHDEMIEVMKAVKDVGNQRNGQSTVPAQQPSAAAEVKSSTPDDEDWQVIGPKNRGCVTRSTNYSKTPVSNLFLGVMRSALHAHSNHSSEFEPYFSLQLDIQNEKVNSVRDALAALVAKEPLSGYVCSKTGQEVEASRQTTFEELPPILILHLKCFVYDKSGGCQKLLKRVEFSSDLELSKDFLSPNQKGKLKERQRQYKLFAVVYHDGKEATKGHYVTEVHHIGTASWLRFDDSIIRVVDTPLFKYSLPRMPYLLLYKKVNM